MSAEPDVVRWVPVGEAGEVRMGKQLSPASSQADGMHAPYLRVANVLDGRIDYSDVKTMSFSPVERQRYGLEPGDILLNEGQSLELVGRSAIYEGRPSEYCFQNTLIRFRGGADVIPAYAREVFKIWLEDGTFAAIAKKTTSIAHLGGDRFAKLPFPMAPVGQQQRIVELLDAVQQRIDVEQAALLKLENIWEGALNVELDRHLRDSEPSRLIDVSFAGENMEVTRPLPLIGWRSRAMFVSPILTARGSFPQVTPGPPAFPWRWRGGTSSRRAISSLLELASPPENPTSTGRRMGYAHLLGIW